MSKTKKQELGIFGEELVAKTCSCPKCKRKKSLKRLPTNFKCADIICDFCGYLAQVKTTTVKNIELIPDSLLGAAWKPQKDRMSSGIYFSLFWVLISNRKKAVYFLPSEIQTPKIFKVRKPLSAKAQRAGWQGFNYDLKTMKHKIIRIF